MIFQTGHTEEYIRTNFFETYMDNLGILRWQSNNQIPFDDMLADFKTLELIDENVQLGSNLLREQETEQFWEEFFKQHKKEDTHE
jgi:hypothetical protein